MQNNASIIAKRTKNAGELKVVVKIQGNYPVSCGRHPSPVHSETLSVFFVLMRVGDCKRVTSSDLFRDSSLESLGAHTLQNI